jgi:hypothetical protein
MKALSPALLANPRFMAWYNDPTKLRQFDERCDSFVKNIAAKSRAIADDFGKLVSINCEMMARYSMMTQWLNLENVVPAKRKPQQKAKADPKPKAVAKAEIKPKGAAKAAAKPKPRAKAAAKPKPTVKPAAKPRGKSRVLSSDDEA